MKVNILQKEKRRGREREKAFLLRRLLFCEQELSNKTTILGRKTKGRFRGAVFTPSAQMQPGGLSALPGMTELHQSPASRAGMRDSLMSGIQFHRTHSLMDSILCRNHKHAVLSSPISGAVHAHRRRPSCTLRMSFFRSVAKWGQPSPGPRTPSSTPAASHLGGANPGHGECSCPDAWWA